MNAPHPLAARLRHAWQQLAPREQALVGVATAVVGLGLLWWIGLAPALRTLAAAPAEHARLDAQLQQMEQLQDRARALRSQPHASRDDALPALERSVQQALGAEAQLQAAGGAGETVGVALRGASATALGDWLAQARNNARALPREAHLTRSQAVVTPPSPPSPPSPPTAVTPASLVKAALAGAGASAPPPNPGTAPLPRWDGTLVMALPANR